ncbi:unnamed protein product [Closterium sp. Yama58-4]|nr:unnamed protein product [Closterium sp. Yama58-4]
MVPVYATMSFFALAFSEYAMYFNTIRDVYEAWVIYNFLSLCLAWVGGPGVVVTSLAGRVLKPSIVLGTCCLPPMPLDGRFIRRCKQGCLQFVFLKPILAALSLILYSYGLYNDGNFSAFDSYLYITCVYMLSYSVAIYALILFYVACKDLLHSFNPIPKFLMIKAVVFLTYWQGVIIFLIAHFTASPEGAADLQNVIICCEMALGAIGFMIAFPVKPYMVANVGTSGAGPMDFQGFGLAGLGLANMSEEQKGALIAAFKHSVNMGDVVSDTVHQFAPTYHDYVLYSDGSQDKPQHYRTRTFVPAGKEMENARRMGQTFSSGRTGLLTAEATASERRFANLFASITPVAAAGAAAILDSPSGEPSSSYDPVPVKKTSSSSLSRSSSKGGEGVGVRGSGSEGEPLSRRASSINEEENSRLRRSSGAASKKENEFGFLMNEDDMIEEGDPRLDLEGFVTG